MWLSAIAHLMAAATGAQPWFEFVARGVNWSGGASRQSFLNSFFRGHGFTLTRVSVSEHW